MVLFRFSFLAPLTFEEVFVNKRIYVGNLPFSATESEVNDLFRQFGTIESCHLVTDRDTGRSKGFAFVEMSTDDEADKAIENLNNQEMDGRSLNINEARPKNESSRGGGGYGQSRGGGGGGYGGGGYGGQSRGGGRRGGY